MAFNIKQNDTSPSLQATLKDAAQVAINLTGGSVQLHMKALDGTLKVDTPMTIVDDLNGVVQYDWQVGDTDTVGAYYVEFQVTYYDASVETFPNNGSKIVSVVRELN